ncbi:MAG: arylsulfatase, partial [Planctomycetales bacterium]|nr:arylsulfatase [Planctomycetales bacterium]
KTFCQLAGATIPSDVQPIDGRSLLPLLENPKADWKDRVLFVHQGRWEKGADPNGSKFKNCAVRTTRWRFVNNKELYDISMDPYEAANVAEDHPDLIAKLRNAYDRWWEETLPLMVNEDAPYAPHQPQAVRYEKQLAERGIPDWIPPQL